MTNADFLRYKALIFIFPGAVLADSVEPYLSRGFFDVLVFSLVFLFIPVEAYSSHLWEQVNAHRRSGSNLDYVRETALVLIDLLRVSFLTLAIAQYPRLTPSGTSDRSLENLALFLGTFFLLNFLWNVVASPLVGSIKNIFALRLGQIRASGRAVEIAVARATSALLVLNKLAFFYFFPLVAIVILVGFALGRLASPDTGGVAILGAALRNNYVGLFVGFLIIQIVLKLTQIAVIRVVLSIDSAFGDSRTSPHEGLISQVASEGNYSVYVVNANVLSLQQTNLQLTHLMAARMQLYLSDKRRQYFDIEHLVFDPTWDQASAHIVHMEDDQIAGMIRITPSVDGRLPISEVFPELLFADPSYELSRMIVDDRFRAGGSVGSLIAVRLFVGCAEYLRVRSPQSIVIDAIVGTECVIKESTYGRMGFAPQNLRYRDKRYGADSVVLKAATSTDVARFFGWSNRMRTRWGRR